MVRKPSSRLVGVLLGACLLLLAGTAALSSARAAAPQTVTYVAAITEDITTENPWAAYGPDATYTNQLVSDLVYSRLYRWSADQHWVPTYADGFPTPLVESGGTWNSQVTLKSGLTWSDGAAVTADDVAFTAAAVLDLGLYDGMWGTYYGGVDLADVVIINAATVEFRFNTRPDWTAYHGQLLLSPILAEHYWAPIVVDALVDPDPIAYLTAYTPVGEPTSGPFVRAGWVPSSSVTLAADPLYALTGVEITQYASGAYYEELDGVYTFSAYGTPGGAIRRQHTVGPFVDEVRLEIEALDTALSRVEACTVETVIDPYSISADHIDDAPLALWLRNPQNNLFYLGFNFAHAPTSVHAYRLATAYLFDHAALGATHDIYAGHDYIQPLNFFWHQDTNGPGAGLTRAERFEAAFNALDAAGYTWDTPPAWDPALAPGAGLRYPGGDLVPSIEILGLTPDYDPIRTTVALSLTQWMTDFGIQATTTLTSFNGIVDIVFNGAADWDVFTLGWIIDAPPNLLVEGFRTGGELNVLGYADAGFDALADSYMNAADAAAAQPFAHEMQLELVNDLPYLNTHARPRYQPFAGCGAFDLPYSQAIGGVPFRPELVRPAAGTVLISSDNAETARLLTFGPGDIAAHKLATGDWLPYFDAAAVGLDGADIDAFLPYIGGRLVLSFAEPTAVPGIGTVDDSDLVAYNPANGQFLWAFDGSDVGLTTDAEDIDAIAIVNGDLALSTRGAFSVPGVSGEDEDFILFTDAVFGPATSGTWSLYFDGSDIGLGAAEARDLDAAWYDAGALYLSPAGAFTLAGLSIEAADVAVCALASTGDATACQLANSGLFWRGGEAGLVGNVDALSIDDLGGTPPSIPALDRLLVR